MYIWLGVVNILLTLFFMWLDIEVHISEFFFTWLIISKHVLNKNNIMITLREY